MTNILESKQLSKSFNSKTVLNKIDLTIEKGEIFGFVGRNGAGKSTFIHALTDIVHPSQGSFTMLGVTDQDINQIKNKIGVMPDVANLYEQMKGLQFMQYMGELIGDKRKKQAYQELLHAVGLEDAGHKKIKTYSFGMKKKISIAQALLGEPELIILDEPTSGVDPESAIKIRDLIVKLKNQGKTIFLTSHNLDEIERISDRVGILDEGVIKRIGRPNALKSNVEAQIQLSVQTEPLLTKGALQELEGDFHLEVAFIKSKEHHAQLSLASVEDVPLLSRALIESGYLLYEIKIQEESLEDVFMSV